ncbi:hypothetical protein GUJ93_ZPchr0007g4626 [Zizania palustris]|uniref:Uncharacterized protein n=1 Tax=Zizania palustris TaxID=103762 RepID=A0A8J5T732_ZIZPA|nr:hypothetical protein GUJ93_ZPchr0007g4626 [Zizania palustris]
MGAIVVAEAALVSDMEWVIWELMATGMNHMQLKSTSLGKANLRDSLCMPMPTSPYPRGSIPTFPPRPNPLLNVVGDQDHKEDRDECYGFEIQV